MTTVGIDLGGTHVRAALVDDDGRVLHRVRCETPHDVSEPVFVVELADEVLVAAGAVTVRGIVVGVPGVVDYDDERLLAAPNLPESWAPLLSGSWLGDRLGLPVALANDADLAAVGEATFGAGRGTRDVVYVTISTGVGAGMVLDGRLVHGRYSAGEIGHTVIDRGRARAGERATTEELGSGTALNRLAAEADLSATGRALADLVRSGHAEASRVWDEAIGTTALAIVNLCWLVAPQLVVIGGGVGMNADLVLPIVRDALSAHGPDFLDIEVTSAQLGDDAALSGSAAWWDATGRHG